MSLFSKLSAAALMLGALLFASAALACDNCGGGYGYSGYYGGQETYSCNNGLYDCGAGSSYYHPPCDDGCYRRSGCYSGCYGHRSSWRRGYIRGFHDGFDTARYDGDGWRPHDGYHGDYDRDRHDWHDGDRYDNHDWHDGDRHDYHDGY